MPVTIIAEAGLNHDGDIEKALDLCEAARDAGADVVKFQTFLPEKLLRAGHPRMDAARKLALSFPDTLRVARHCEALGIEFCSTPDDLDSLKFLVEECGVNRIKIGSGSLFYEPLVDAAFDTGLPVLLSTGMATRKEIDNEIFRQGKRIGGEFNKTTVMHCVSLYPCPLHLANVSVIRSMIEQQAFVYEIGYSDHTEGFDACLAAAALGATVIEKHFTLNVMDYGPDHRISMGPENFHLLVDMIRRIESALGDGRKEPSDEERAMIPRLRKDAEGFQPGL